MNCLHSRRQPAGAATAAALKLNNIRSSPTWAARVWLLRWLRCAIRMDKIRKRDHVNARLSVPQASTSRGAQVANPLFTG